MGTDIERWVADQKAQREFLRRAVMLIFNEGPERDFQPFKYELYGLYRPPTQSKMREPAWIKSRIVDRAWDKINSYPRTEAGYPQAFAVMTPEEKQVFLQSGIWEQLTYPERRSALALGFSLETDITDVVGFSGLYGQPLKYGLTPAQKHMLKKVAKAFEAFVKWQTSEERAIGEVLEIEEETIHRMTKLGETYRF